MRTRLFDIQTTTRTAMAMLALLLLSVMPAHADGLYDGLYDRPTYYPDFTLPTKWPSVMSYFVCARLDGQRLHNYEVAVYDQNDSLRCVGRSIAGQQELCTLTIPGDAGDEFHFRVVYGDFRQPTIADVPETCVFVANAFRGTLEYPFWLTLPSTAAIAAPAAAAKDYTLYNIYGSRVGKAVLPGIYIRNGKKYILR